VALIVQKYGGTSVADVDRIRHVARRCLAARRRGDDVVVVASAMAGETDRLLGLVRRISARPDRREQDQVVAAGEQVTVGLLSLAIQEEGGRARSFLGHQVRIVTDGAFTRARIRSVDAGRIHEALAEGRIAVVAGFQGIDGAGNLTTLGRGGSDTTAVAIAAALGADACEIYTDVDGVYTADPRICPAARGLPRVSYEEMLELASQGAKVLQIRSVGLAMRHRVPLWVKSSFTTGPGTLVGEEGGAMEELAIAGIACDRHGAKVAIRGCPDVPGVVARVFAPLAEAGVVVDMIVQNVSRDGRTDVTFTVDAADLDRAEEVAGGIVRAVGAERVDVDRGVAKVAVVGVGMRNHAFVAARMFEVLAGLGINIQAISTSEIKVAVLIGESRVEEAVRALHAAFGLDGATPIAGTGAG
jgi:aspartate kinase